ncbi:MAG: MFS transporter [Burkholderiales bacterium]|nr:MFS transporter [Burkholderiales bacterium]
MSAGRFSAMDGFRYGLLGLPLAFVALPLYVVLPNHYAREFGVPLATLGVVLLAARLLDAVSDPLIGRWSDRLFARSTRAVLALGAGAAFVLALGFALLFFPPGREPAVLVGWAAAMLVVTYAGYSVLSVTHQSWGAMLGGDEAQRSRIVGWREGLGLAGVLLASVLPLTLGLAATAMVFAVALAAGWTAWARARRPEPQTRQRTGSVWAPFAQPAFRRLLAVFMLNGIASAVPATLVLFFVQDRLQAPPGIEPVFLAAYFFCAALSMPVWLRIVRRLGLARSWLAGMALATGVFIWAALLGPGDTAAFITVCALSGAALGADLALPGALLAGVIARAGDRGRGEGAYFGWWNFATKLNLALAAGLALPLLQLAGYSPGARDAQALQALGIAYCLLPCLLKLAAAATLYLTLIRTGSDS